MDHTEQDFLDLIKGLEQQYLVELITELLEDKAINHDKMVEILERCS